MYVLAPWRLWRFPLNSDDIRYASIAHKTIDSIRNINESLRKVALLSRQAAVTKVTGTRGPITRYTAPATLPSVILTAEYAYTTKLKQVKGNECVRPGY